MKLGFIFPGQGSQTIGMGKDIYDNIEIYCDTLKKISEITKKNMAKLTFYSEQEKLNATENTQLAILSMSLGILEILKQEKIVPEAMAGLSLGEFTALIYDNMISFEEGVKLVQARGEVMSKFCPDGNWAMAAILGLEDKKVEQICQRVNNCGFISPANYNCPRTGGCFWGTRSCSKGNGRIKIRRS